MSEHPKGVSPAAAVAVVGSPSTTTTVTLNLLRAAFNVAVYGQMVCFTIRLTDPADPSVERTELALGTITSVETVNPIHSTRASEAQHVADRGTIPGSGHEGDTRAVSVAVESVFRRDDTTGGWAPAGQTLSNSPATGTAVTLLTQAVVDDLMVGVPAQRWLGTLRGTDILVPYTSRDFSGARGATHDVVCGATGSGKTAATAYMLACDLYYDDLGQVIIDPQGQWATEWGLPFSLQGLATALGRTVTVARLSRNLRLRADVGMFTELLAKVGLFAEIAFGASAADQVANACRVMEDALHDKNAVARACGVGDWTEADPVKLLTYLLKDLRETLPAGTIYAGREGQQRIAYAIARPSEAEAEAEGLTEAMVARLRPGVLDQAPSGPGHRGGRRWVAVADRFSLVHNLWSQWTPEGAALIASGADPDSVPPAYRRHRAWPLLMDVFTRRPDRPAPWLILDLSADDVLPGAGTDDDEVVAARAAASQVLDHPGVKARIIRQLVDDLGRAGTQAFKDGRPLNVRVQFDEAWAFALQPDAGTDRAVAALSDRLEDGCRDMRKIGVGLRFILQAPSGLREGIWKQCSYRAVGYGITENTDLKRLSNIVGDQHLGLYLSTAGPEATGRYPFMLTGGGVTGLSFGSRPVFVNVFTNITEWLHANQGWVTPARLRWSARLPTGDPGGPLTACPPRPVQDSAIEAHVHAKGLRVGAANQAAATRLLTAASTTPRGPFGMPQSRPVPVPPDDPPPPF